jgi:hypothetical protein
MTQLEQLTGFDYSTLGAGVREDITKATTNIRKRARRMATDILEIGLEARRVKSYLDHGQFVQWVEAEFAEEFGWSYQSVMRFVQVSEHFSQTSQIERFGKSALYLLSQNNTPEEAREEARERAEAGEQITHQAAKEMVQRHRQPDRENCRQHPAEPEPLHADLLNELSRLGWELRSSRISPMGLHLYTFADDGGRGQTEERTAEGWEQMRDDLQADEQRSLVAKIRGIVQRLHQEDCSREAYELIRRITDTRQREALQAEIDAGLDRLARAQRCNEYKKRFPHGALVVWQRRYDPVVGRSRGMSFGGERLRLMIPPDSADCMHEHTVDPAKCREYNQSADAHLLEPEPEPEQRAAAGAALERQQAAYRAVHHTVLSMTEEQRRLLALAFGCEYTAVIESVWDRVWKGQIKDEVCKLLEVEI